MLILQNSLIINKEFQRSIRMVKDYASAYELLTNYPKKYVFIADRSGTEFQIIKDKMEYYLPPRFKDSNVFMDIIGIGFKKNFVLIEPCNVM